MRRVDLIVQGQPYSKVRPRVTARGTYTPGIQKANADMLSWEMRAACKGDKFPGNVAVRLVFYRSNRQRIDLDNLVKQVLDAANGVMWKDDAQVTAILARLHYDRDNPRTEISIAEDPNSSMVRGDAMALVTTCQRCGKNFHYRPYPSQKPPRYCSRSCKAEAPCAECGSIFTKNHPAQKFCSKACGTKSKLTRARIGDAARRRAVPLPNCRDCGAPLHRHNAVLCRPCWLRNTRRRKALIATGGDGFPVREVRRCAICGTEMAGAHPNRMYCQAACWNEKRRQAAAA